MGMYIGHEMNEQIDFNQVGVCPGKNVRHTREVLLVINSPRYKGLGVEIFDHESPDMDVSENSGLPPKSSIKNRVFHSKPSILGHPLFLETPIW